MVAIDPRPVWGDPDVDAVDWVLAGTVDFATLRQRIGRLAELVPGQSPDRVLRWCQAFAIIVAAPRIWARRDDEETRFLIALARYDVR